MWSNSLGRLIFLLVTVKCVLTVDSAWRWTCVDNTCEKKEMAPNDSDPALNLESCKMFCNKYGLLWPKPTGEVDLGGHLSKISLNKTNIVIANHGSSDQLMISAGELFMETVNLVIPKNARPKSKAKSLMIFLVNKNPDVQRLKLDVDESYKLEIEPFDTQINVTVTANTFFGIRHGLQTLSQLIFYDDHRDHILIPRNVVIEDKPVYPYRGILLDTARNYYTVDSIKRTLDGMAAVKLNTFHWHITDSQSFPFVSQRRPELTKYGAFSPSKIYTKDAISDIVEYGLVRGIRVLPEFDAPAHVGEGWQKTNLTVCFKAEPWRKYCVEPPCGQLDPSKDALYDVLEDIYKDMADVFNPDIFHMGGDEVNSNCWNSSKDIQNFVKANNWNYGKTGFLELWNYFQKEAQHRAYKAFGKQIPLILWTSTLTEYDHIQKYLDNNDYIIQVWTTGVDPQIKGLLDRGYRLIISNYDALYLDCGFSSWVGTGNNWCSPYIGWQKVYDNKLSQMAKVETKHLIIGGEAALWSEQSDSATLDGRLWPRAAAFAERLWAEPTTDWRQAEQRMLHIRERLVKLGVQADSIEPEWCYQNEGSCYT